MKRLTAAAVKRLIPRRPLTSHKGHNGHVLLIAGSRGMTGAAILSALGALKSGAGLVTVGAPKSVLDLLTRRLPEAMSLLLPETKAGCLSTAAIKRIQDYVRRRTITTLAIGPGLSVHPALRQVIQAVFRLRRPIVVDADGLNNISRQDLNDREVIITPHAGELARLLGIPRAMVEKHRQTIARDTAKKLKIICVLKGHQTVISDGRSTFLNSTGNPAMATGGMGDVLTGLIAGLLAQGLSLFDAACAGVYLHGLAGDLAAVGDRGLLASELAEKIPHALRRVAQRGTEKAG